MAGLKVVSFDLDDTLWEIKPVLIAAEKKVLGFLKQHSPAVFERFSSEQIMQHRMELYRSRPDLHHQISQLRIESVRSLLLASDYDEAEAERLSHAAFEVFIQARHQVECFDGVEQVLAELQQRYALAALTNGNADVMRLPIGQYFDFSLKAEDINSSKPAAPHFEHTLERYDIEPGQMVHIGDHPEHDIEAAQKLGIQTVWMNAHGGQWANAQAPDAQVQSVGELPGVIARLDSV